MIGFAVLFGLLAVFLAQTWLNNQADARMKSLEANRKAPAPERTIVVANRPLRFGDELNATALREQSWPADALPAGAFGKIADLTAEKRIVLMPIDVNEAVLASKITGPGQRATLSAVLGPGMKAVTVRVNDVQGVAGFVLPGDRVDVLLTRQGEKNFAATDVVVEDVPVLAIEAGVSHFWRAYAGFEGDVVGIDRFGESAPAEQVAAALGLTAQAVCLRARRLVQAKQSA